MQSVRHAHLGHGVYLKLAASTEGETLSGALSRKEKDGQSNSYAVSMKSHHVQVAINSTHSKFSHVLKIVRS